MTEAVKRALTPAKPLEHLIRVERGLPGMLDADLAALRSVETRAAESGCSATADPRL